MLLGDLNLNSLSYNNDRKITQISDKIYTNSSIPYIKLPTWITKHSETHIINIFYDKTIPDLIAGNVTTGIIK